MRQSALLVGVLLAALMAVGCQTMEPMSRPDADATLQRPSDWVREGEREVDTILYFIGHPSEDVHVQFRRLEDPLVEPAHALWVQMWLRELYEDVGDIDVSTHTLDDSGEATRVRASATWQGEPVRLDILMTNAAGQTFALEAWGVPAAMAQTSEVRARIADSARLPSEAAAIEPAASVEVEAGHWAVVLPSPSGDDIAASWRVEQPTESRAYFNLAGMLISAELLAEQLPYPIGADRYAHEALDNDGVPPESETGAVTVVTTDEAMVRTHRFVTSGERAAHLVVSTPEPLYEMNRETIEALIGSLVVDANKAGSPDGEPSE